VYGLYLVGAVVEVQMGIRQFDKQVVHLKFNLIIIDRIFLPSINHEDDGEKTGHGTRQRDMVQHIAACSETSYCRAEETVDLILLCELLKIKYMWLGHRQGILLFRKDRHFFVKYQRKKAEVSFFAKNSPFFVKLPSDNLLIFATETNNQKQLITNSLW
jgi:hypothetical protein